MADFDYELPAGRIAQHPVDPRSSARLLVGLGGQIEHRTVDQLASLVGPGDLLVVNETRVIPARLRLHKASGGAVEVLLLEPSSEPGSWEALVRPGRRVPSGTPLFADQIQVAQVGDALEGGRRLVQLAAAPQDIGEVPLPPYITTPLSDPERYQTVYARRPGSVAAPTAGLHLTEEVLDECRAKGAKVAAVELAVGLDTFRPITEQRAEDHQMHSERYSVPPETMEACRRAERVLAIGTTTVRALESAAATGELEGRTDLYIRPGFRFTVVDILLTNFHLPRSSLLLMLAAFAGDRWRDLYDVALSEGYRFLSFGDAMLIDRHDTAGADRRL